METSTKGNLRTTKFTVTEFIPTPLARDTKVNGRKTCNTEKALRMLQTAASILVITSRAEKVDRALSFGLTELSTKDNGTMIILTALENTSGLMAANIKGTGKTTNSKELEYILGPTAKDTRESTLTTRSTAKGLIFSQTVANTPEDGSKVSNMDLVPLLTSKANRREESGTKAG